MTQAIAKPSRSREAPQRRAAVVIPPRPEPVAPPKMRVVSKGWHYCESLQTQEQVEEQTGECR